MYFQLVLIFIAFLFLKLYNKLYVENVSRRKYVNLLVFLLILQSSLRHVAVGADTFSYYESFEEVKQTSWNDIFYNFYTVYILHEGKDPGFDLLQKIFQLFFSNYHIFLLFISIAFFVPLGKVVKSGSLTLKEIFLSFCLYQAMFYYFFSITGIRQTIATIATLCGIQLIKDKKLFSFLSLILLAALIHKSVLIFLPFYFICKLKNSKIVLLLSICTVPFIIMVARPFATLLATYSGSSDYMYYAQSDFQTTGATNFLLIMICAAVLVYFSKQHNSEAISDLDVMAIALALFFTPLTWVDPSLMRVVQYYSIFMLVALPKAIFNIKCSRLKQNMIYIMFVFVFIFTIIKYNMDYAFFWQSMSLGENYR